jgi:hypothetical protein
MYIDIQFKRKHLQSFLKSAASISSRDIQKAIFQFASNPRPAELAVLLRSLTTSGIWISHSTMRYMLSLLPRKYKGTSSSALPTEQSSLLFEAIRSKAPLPEGIDHEQAFTNLFHDIEFSHRHSLYEGRITPPKINSTLVLVSGVLNEIFSTPAFARGAEYLSNKTGLKRISLHASGTKGSKHNSQKLLRQLETYLEQNPDEKLWIVAFSKGGLDLLHFMHEQPDFSNRHIQGVSLMATPILGSGYLKNRALSTLNHIEDLAFKGGFKNFQEQYDFLAKGLRESLSEEYQADWFKSYYHELPKKPFYTSLAFESTWYQSHIWMVLTKLLLQSNLPNDGVVDVDRARFPDYFQGVNLGVIQGHHLVGTRSSFFSQEALLEAHLIYLNYLGLLD